MNPIGDRRKGRWANLAAWTAAAFSYRTRESELRLRQNLTACLFKWSKAR